VPPAHPRTISNNHYLLSQASIIFLLLFGRHDSDDSAAFPEFAGRPTLKLLPGIPQRS